MKSESSTSRQLASVSIVVPVCNEQRALPAFHRSLTAVLRELTVSWEIVYVDDGSGDGSTDLLALLAASCRQVTVVELSRNFGKENAITAGLDHAGGEAVIIMDSDGQDPPEEIPRMLDAWRRGFDVVAMRRRRREGESWLKRATAFAFYRLAARIADFEIPADVGDFRLLGRPVVEALQRLPERTRFMKGLFAWVGFPTTVLEFERRSRAAGRSKFNYWRLWNFALEGITSFTVAPLKIAGYVGFATALASFLYGGYVLIKTMLFGDPVQGFPTLAVAMLFLGGTQLLAIGVLGEYVARIFIECKGRPLYVVRALRGDAREHERSRRRIA